MVAMAEWLTTSEAASRLGVSRNTINEYIKDGTIAAHRTAGGHARIAIETIESLLRSRETRARPTGGAEVIAVAHHAGGVGKTTTTLNLGYALANQGRRVLLVDLDPQADLSTRLGVVPADPALGRALLEPGLAPHPATVEWGGVRLDALAGTLDMAGVELRLTGLNSRELRLKNALTQSDGTIAPAMQTYDYILLDCPPSLSTLTQNALYAASSVLVPIQAHDKAFLALDLLLGTIRDVDRFRPTPLRLLGLLLTMTDPTIMANQVEGGLRANYGAEVFTVTIPDRVEARTEHRRLAPVTFSAPRNDAAHAYLDLALEVIARVEH